MTNQVKIIIKQKYMVGPTKYARINQNLFAKS
jgi:hypothetical protein